MKVLLRHLVVCFLMCLLPAHAEKASPALTEIHKQLIAALEKENADNADWDDRQRGAMGRIMQMVRDIRPETIDSGQLRQISLYSKPGEFSETTETLFQLFRDQANLQIETRKGKLASEFKEKVRGYLLRAFATTEPDEIAGIQRELVAYGEEIQRLNHRDARSALPNSGSVHNPKNVLDYLERFLRAGELEDWSSAGSHLNNVDGAMKNVEPYLSAKETMEIMAKLRRDAGVVSPKEFEAVYQKMLEELLDDSNQDRIEEIRASIQKYRSLSGSSSGGGSSPSQRWQRMESFASALLQAIQRVKDGGVPQISPDTWTRTDSSYQTLMAKEKLVEALGKYRVKVRTDEGEVNEARLYYTIGELRDASTELLAEVLDDANQDRLDEIQERVRVFQRFSSSATEFQNVSQRFQQLGSFVQMFHQAVRRTQEGGVPRMNLDEWLRSGSEYGSLIEKNKLSGMLKKYMVKVTGVDGKVREEPLYQEVDDILARINTLADIQRELRGLALISRSASYESGQVGIGQGVSVLTGLGEIHAKLNKGDPFVLQNPQVSGMYDGSIRSGQPDLMEEDLLASKLAILRNEAERAVLERMFAGEIIEEFSNRDDMVNGLLKKFMEAKNYQAVLGLGRVTAYFQPKQPLVSAYELQAIQNYVDGVRQQEELGEPRLATGHYQRAAAARSSIIPVEELRKRLYQIKQEHPAAYEKGTEDSLAPERALSPFAQPPLIVPSRP